MQLSINSNTILSIDLKIQVICWIITVVRFLIGFTIRDAWLFVGLIAEAILGSWQLLSVICIGIWLKDLKRALHLFVCILYGLMIWLLPPKLPFETNDSIWMRTLIYAVIPILMGAYYFRYSLQFYKKNELSNVD